MLGAVAAIAKFSHGREWTLKYPSETMRRFCGKISNPFREKGDNLLDIHRFQIVLWLTDKTKMISNRDNIRSLGVIFL